MRRRIILHNIKLKAQNKANNGPKIIKTYENHLLTLNSIKRIHSINAPDTSRYHLIFNIKQPAHIKMGCRSPRSSRVRLIPQNLRTRRKLFESFDQSHRPGPLSSIPPSHLFCIYTYKKKAL